MMKFAENLMQPRGIFKMTVRKAGEVIEVYEDHNLIVNNSKLLLAHLIGGDTTGTSITKIGFGTNGASPLPDDAVLKNPFLKTIKTSSYPGFTTEEVDFAPILGLSESLVLTWYGYQVQFDWELLTTEGNGHSISEFGLLSGNNTLFSRKSRGSPIVKEADISIEGSWIITL
jgi:hypothetical protein